MKIPLVDGLQDVMARELLLEPSQLIWDHHGVCHCGRRTFLFSQCEKCARVEAIERQDEIMDKPSLTMRTLSVSYTHLTLPTKA